MENLSAGVNNEIATLCMKAGKELGVQTTINAAEIAFLTFLLDNLSVMNPLMPSEFVEDSKRAFMTELKRIYQTNA